MFCCITIWKKRDIKLSSSYCGNKYIWKPIITTAKHFLEQWEICKGTSLHIHQPDIRLHWIRQIAHMVKLIPAKVDYSLSIYSSLLGLALPFGLSFLLVSTHAPHETYWATKLFYYVLLRILNYFSIII